MKLNPKISTFLKRLGAQHIWDWSLKFVKFRFIPIYIFKLGFRQYLKLLNSQGLGKIIELQVRGYEFPISLRCKTSDLHAFEQIFIKEEYSVNIPFNPEYILDGGANCGYSVVYFATRFPNVNIIAVEPDESNIAMIKKNTVHYSNIHIVKGAVWSENSFLKIMNSSADKWSFRVEKVKFSNLKGFNISHLLQTFNFSRLDILKLDIEGSEKEVFSKHYTHWVNRVKFIFVELHERYAAGVTKIVERTMRENKFKKSKKGENLIFQK